MITFLMLREANFGVLDGLAQSWERFARQSAASEGDWEQQVLGQLARSDWRGGAAEAARRALERHDDFFEVRGMLAGGLVVALNQAALRFRDLQRRLAGVVDEAGAAGYTVTSSGQVWDPSPDVAPMRKMDPELASRYAERPARLEREIHTLIGEANTLDEELAGVLRGFQPYMWGEVDRAEWARASGSIRDAAQLAGVTASAIPADGDVDRARAWWASLTPQQQALYQQAYPERIGTLDGLPTSVRDTANRLALRIAAAEAANVRDERGRDRADKLISTLESGEYTRSVPLYLIDVNNKTTDGTAVVSVGNPDTARHQAVIVPGVTSTLDKMNGEIDRATRLQASADGLTVQPGDVAVVAWLDYDAPGQDETALGTSKAEAGAKTLNQFVDVMQRTSGQNHVTMVGHSYGSVVVGTAASAGGLQVDDIVTAGSPGMNVDNISDLRLDPRHVWAGAAQGDDVSGWMSHFAHGPEPHTDDFGANRYVVDTQGHSAYWDPNTVSLKNQAAVVVGRYGLVTLEHGSPPL